MTRHFINRSGGTGSWYLGRVIMEHLAQPEDEVHFVFADTKMEDEDLYRFLEDTEPLDRAWAERLGLKPVFHTLADGRDVWEVFNDVKYLGNTRIDPCSRILKRDIIRKFLEENFDPADTVCYIGIDWTEEHRYHKAVPYWAPFRVEAPLLRREFLTDKEKIHAVLESEGVALPRLYGMGFAHNNCGGFCVKGGHGSFKLLLEKMPERYAHHEAKEQEFNERHRQNGKQPVTILRDRSKKIIAQRLNMDESDPALPKQLPLSLRDFRLRVQGDLAEVDEFDIGGCACFTPDNDEEMQYDTT